MVSEFDEYLELEDYQLLKGIVICKESGEYLLDLILDTEINPILLSSFVGALSLFGQDNLGKIEEINIKGLDVDIIIVSKYKLILIAIMDKKFMQEGIREEAKMALDMFYMLYQNEIEESVIEINKFDSFKDVLISQIKEHFEKAKQAEQDAKVGDFGFFTNAIKKMRNGNGTNGVNGVNGVNGSNGSNGH